ncbi:MAG TPA: Rrf2 family transcriptional regulator, partial [Ignavibacteriaceae bacterium]
MSKKTEYALMAARYLAIKNSTGNSTAKEISDRYQIPYQLVAKVLQNLARNEIAVSVKGMNGGFSLSRKPEEISLISIIKAVESNYKITDCMKENGSSLDCSH